MGFRSVLPRGWNSEDDQTVVRVDHYEQYAKEYTNDATLTSGDRCPAKNGGSNYVEFGARKCLGVGETKLAARGILLSGKCPCHAIRERLDGFDIDPHAPRCHRVAANCVQAAAEGCMTEYQEHDRHNRQRIPTEMCSPT